MAKDEFIRIKEKRPPRPGLEKRWAGDAISGAVTLNIQPHPQKVNGGRQNGITAGNRLYRWF